MTYLRKESVLKLAGQNDAQTKLSSRELELELTRLVGCAGQDMRLGVLCSKLIEAISKQTVDTHTSPLAECLSVRTLLETSRSMLLLRRSASRLSCSKGSRSVPAFTSLATSFDVDVFLSCSILGPRNLRENQSCLFTVQAMVLTLRLDRDADKTTNIEYTSLGPALGKATPLLSTWTLASACQISNNLCIADKAVKSHRGRVGNCPQMLCAILSTSCSVAASAECWRRLSTGQIYCAASTVTSGCDPSRLTP
jgi:hypothetical protein